MQALLVIAAALAITMESMDDDNTDASDEGEQLFQLVKPSAHKSTASGMMSHGKGWCADSASWCETWTCDGSPWCQASATWSPTYTQGARVRNYWWGGGRTFAAS